MYLRAKEQNSIERDHQDRCGHSDINLFPAVFTIDTVNINIEWYIRKHDLEKGKEYNNFLIYIRTKYFIDPALSNSGNLFK